MDNLKTRKKYQNNYADYDKQRSLTVNRTVGLLNFAICGKEIKNTTRKIVYKWQSMFTNIFFPKTKTVPRRHESTKRGTKEKISKCMNENIAELMMIPRKTFLNHSVQIV